MYRDLFCDYESESRDKLYDYQTKMETYINNKINLKMPYITGEFNNKPYCFLKDKHMENEMRSPIDVLKEMSQYFSKTVRWHHPYMMNNIKTPVNLVSLAVAYNAMFYDPNMVGDTNCGQIAYSELEVIKYLSELVDWNWKKSGGYFTFGGTSTLMNAVKMGINKARKNACQKGINENMFLISSQQGHSAHADVCNWLGIGSEQCLRMPVDTNYQIDISKTEKIISDKIENGGKWVGIIACGGTTIQMIVDPIYQIYMMRERLVKKYELKYRPHIHVDSVVGWIWLFYKNYSFLDNELKLTRNVCYKIKKMYDLISKVKYADSIGIDFHKTGFCPYASSVILVKNCKEVFSLNDKKYFPMEQLIYGDYSPSTYTLELSRSSVGPLTALASLKLFGYKGYQKLLGDIMEGVYHLVQGIKSYDDFEIINEETNGTCILFIIKPVDAKISYCLLKEKEQQIKKIAVYNYKFYLFVLNKIKRQEIDFFIDYSSGFEKVKRGFHMGILKIQIFNPMLTKNKAQILATKIKTLKNEYDSFSDIKIEETMYKPKNFKFKYNNNSYELRGNGICMKE